MSLDLSLTATRPVEVFSASITHNCARMAREAGIYDCLWHPKSLGYVRAVELIVPLNRGVTMMNNAPDRFRALEAGNGCGTYEQFLKWANGVLAACRANPDASISVSR